MEPTLVFVYNAQSGLFNTLADIAHKIFSPGTYACNLCSLTHSPLGMRQEWKQFLSGLGLSLEFLHADELEQRYGIEDAPLPAIFLKEGVRLVPWVDAAAINRCRSLAELQAVIRRRLFLSGD